MGHNLHACLLFFCLFNLSIINRAIDYFGKCKNPECSEHIAIGITTQTYPRNKEDGMSFPPGENVFIYVRDYGEKKDMLGIEINGKRGYVRKSFIKETSVKEKHLVPAAGTFLDPTRTVTTNADSSSSQASPSTNTESSEFSSSETSVVEKTSASSQISTSSFVDSPTSTSTEQSPIAETSVSSTSTSLNTEYADHAVPSADTDSSTLGAESSNTQSLFSSSVPEKNTRNIEASVSQLPPELSTVSPSFSSIGETSTEQSEAIHAIDPSSKILFNMKNEMNAAITKALNDVASHEAASQTRETITKALDSVASHLAGSQIIKTKRDDDSLEDIESTISALNKQGENGSDVVYGQGTSEQITSSPQTPTQRPFATEIPHYYNILNPQSGNRNSQSTKTGGSTSEPATDFTAPEIPKDVSFDHGTKEEISQPGPLMGLQEATHSENSNVHASTGDVKNGIDSEGHNNISTDFEDVEEEEEEDGDEDDDEELEEEITDKESEVTEKAATTETTEYEGTEKAVDSEAKENPAETNELNVTESIHVHEKENSVVEEFKNETHIADSELLDENLSKEHETPKNANGSETATISELGEQIEFNRTTDSPTPPNRHILSDIKSNSLDATVEPNSPEEYEDQRDSSSNLAENESFETTEDVTSFFSFSYLFETYRNSITALRSTLDMLIFWIPEPVHAYIDNANISSRAVVFTSIIAFPCALLFFATFFLKERSKEQELIDKLRETEHQLYLATTERSVLREETKTLKEQLTTADDDLDEEKNSTEVMLKQLAAMENKHKDVVSEQITILDRIQELQEKDKSNCECIKGLEDSLKQLSLDKEYTSAQLSDALETITSLTEENDTLKEDNDSIKSEKEYKVTVMGETIEQNLKQISKLEESCAQLLQEAVDWNTRVNELTDQLYNQVSLKEELEETLTSKDSQITTLKTALSNVEALQNTDDDINDNKTVEDKIKVLMDVSLLQNQLKKTEEMRDSLAERLQQEKSNIVQLEVNMMELRAEEEKMKINYNQALQDKTEAQTKLDVLTKYFKDKELQLQRELGVQEAVRQRKEEHATHAERRVLLIEKENESYKYQVASLKQEIEDTERNLKNQISAQEKKAHENWLAARAAERKAEDMKQETATLRQRLTLLEREQENWLNTSQNEILRPAPQRLSDGHDLFSSHEGSISSEYIPRHLPPPPPPPMLDDLPMLRGGHRPMLPPAPPPMMPPFMPPFDPMMPLPPHRPQPWRYVPDLKKYDRDRRNTPSDYEGSSLPRKHQTPPYHDGGDRRSSSPGDGNSRSRGSSPHERLPDFHDLPPPMPRHMEFQSRFTPPMASSRLPYKNLPTPPRPSNRSANSHRPSSDDYRRSHPDADV